jgi:hypothetical protein
MIGHAISEVGCVLPTAVAWVHSRGSDVGFLGDKLAIRRELFSFTLQIMISSMLHIHLSSSGSVKVDLYEATAPRTVSPPPFTIIIKTSSSKDGAANYIQSGPKDS